MRCLPPFPRRTRMEPRRSSRSLSNNTSASLILRPARHKTTISPRTRSPSTPLPRLSHDRDDLLDRRWIGRIAATLVARRATAMKARQRRRRPTPSSSVQKYDRHEDSSLRYRSPHRPHAKGRVRAERSHGSLRQVAAECERIQSCDRSMIYLARRIALDHAGVDLDILSRPSDPVRGQGPQQHHERGALVAVGQRVVLRQMRHEHRGVVDEIRQGPLQIDMTQL